MVNHTILLSKLKIYRLDKDSLYWFESYLNDRTQLVSYKGNLSTVDTITSGVPQGSILGPLLFLMFINDLPLHTSTQTDIFADDTSLHCKLKRAKTTPNSVSALLGPKLFWPYAKAILALESWIGTHGAILGMEESQIGPTLCRNGPIIFQFSPINCQYGPTDQNDSHVRVCFGPT